MARGSGMPKSQAGVRVLGRPKSSPEVFEGLPPLCLQWSADYSGERRVVIVQRC